MSSHKGRHESLNSQQRLEHLNSVLRAIRNVNELIIREKDPDALIEQACNLLVETRGYYSAWIAFLDGEGGVRTAAESGLGEALQPLVERLQRGEFTECARRALAEPGVRVTKDPLVECADCPLSHAYEGRSGMTVRLAHGGRTYGLMSASIPAKYAQDDEEAELFREVAGDIAYAVHSIAVGDERNRCAVEALRESNEYLNSLINYANAPLVVWDSQFRITIFNHAFEQLAGRTSIGVVGQPLEILFPPSSKESSMMLIRETLSSERWESVEIPVLHSDDSVRAVLWNTATVFALDGKTPLATIAQGQDITTRKRVETALRESNEYLERLFNYANAPILVWDSQFRITRFNHAFERLAGRTSIGVVGQPIEVLFPPALEESSMMLIRETLSSERWEVVEIPVLHSDGSVRAVLWSAATVFAPDGKTPLATIAQGQDITERKRIETNLRASIEMRRLAQRVVDVREDERTTLARELHDTAGQGITAVKLDVGHIKKHLEQGQAPTPEELGALNDLLDRTADDVRRISSELRPGALDDFGLEGAIEWQIDELKKRTDLGFIVSLPSEECQLDEARRTALFRVFQELLTNVVRHADARSVQVTLEHEDSVCTLTVADDGCGVDLEELEHTSSIGIIGMRERLRPYGGELHYDGAPGRGTTARVVMPME